MSEVRNAAEFRLRLREYRGRYERVFSKQRSQLARTATPPESPPYLVKREIDELLEAHVREYFINAFLLALNWRTGAAPEDGVPNLSIEVPVKSLVSGRTRFLDYLGTESETSAPLLIVEAKRPGYELPRVLRPGNVISATYGEVISRGLSGQRLSGDWSEWLESLRDYMSSTEKRWGRAPKRVVITNGDWLVAFLDPRNAFSREERADALRILVFHRSAELEARSSEVFVQLEYYRVLGESPPLHLGDVLFHLEPEATAGAMHGIKMLYVEDPRLVLPPSPKIRVAPVVFVELANGGCLRVDGNEKDFAMSDWKADPSEHFREVDEAAKILLQEVRDRLGAELPLRALTNSSVRAEAVGVRKLSRADGRSEYVIATGTHTHFCHQSPSINNCPYHRWEASARDGVAATAEPRLQQSVSPPSFFRSGDPNHCSHISVAFAKSAPITSENAQRCGWRSSHVGEPFCAIWEFETELCCRTCSFEFACVGSQVFLLPCAPG